jgi:hypothetical protein
MHGTFFTGGRGVATPSDTNEGDKDTNSGDSADRVDCIVAEVGIYLPRADGFNFCIKNTKVLYKKMFKIKIDSRFFPFSKVASPRGAYTE